MAIKFSSKSTPFDCKHKTLIPFQRLQTSHTQSYKKQPLSTGNCNELTLTTHAITE